MGNEMVMQLLNATGLPLDIAEKMFMSLMRKHGKSATTITLDELRDILADFMQEALLEAKTFSKSELY